MVIQKDFKAVAEIIDSQQKYTLPNAVGYAVKENLRNVAKKLADYFATQNPHFDRERFMKACGL